MFRCQIQRYNTKIKYIQQIIKYNSRFAYLLVSNLFGEVFECFGAKQRHLHGSRRPAPVCHAPHERQILERAEDLGRASAEHRSRDGVAQSGHRAPLVHCARGRHGERRGPAGRNIHHRFGFGKRGHCVCTRSSAGSVRSRGGVDGRGGGGGVSVGGQDDRADCAAEEVVAAVAKRGGAIRAPCKERSGAIRDRGSAGHGRSARGGGGVAQRQTCRERRLDRTRKTRYRTRA